MEGVNIAKLLKPGDRSFTAEEVRLIGPNGEQVGVVSLVNARAKAVEAALDLVIVADQVEPPVLRIMDFGKIQFEQKKNIRAQRKNNIAQKNKEVKFHVNIDAHDYDYKLKHALEFLEKGYKLKVTLMLRGREMAHKDMAFELIERVIADLEGHGDPDSKPKLQGRNITVNFAPKGGKH